MSTLTSQATVTFLEEVETDASHPSWLLYRRIGDFHPFFYLLEQRYKGKIKRPADIFDNFLELSIDANETVFALMQAALKHFPIWDTEWKHSPRAGLLWIAEQLSWPASTKGTIVGRYMGRHAAAKVCPFVHSDPFRQNDVLWRLPMLKHGRQTPPGYCPANPVLRAPTYEGQWWIEQLFEEVNISGLGPFRHTVRGCGAASTAEMRLVTTSLILSDSLGLKDFYS